jgi:hypothetical protein
MRDWAIHNIFTVSQNMLIGTMCKLRQCKYAASDDVLGAKDTLR